MKDEMAESAIEQYASDIEVILSSDKPPRAVLARVTNWTTIIFGWLDKMKKGDGQLEWLLSSVECRNKGPLGSNVTQRVGMAGQCRNS